MSAVEGVFKPKGVQSRTKFGSGNAVIANPLDSSDSTTAPGGTIGLQAPEPLEVYGLRDVHVPGGFHVAWFSPDGLLYGAGGGDKRLTVYNVTNGSIKSVLSFSTTVRASAASPVKSDDGGFLFAVGEEEGGFKVFAGPGPAEGQWKPVSQGRAPSDLGKQGGVNACAFSSKFLAVGWVQGAVLIYQTATTTGEDALPTHRLQLGAGRINSGCLFFSQNYLAGSSVEMTTTQASVVKLWKVEENFEEARCIEFASPAWRVSIDSDENAFAIGTEDGAVRIYSSMHDKEPWLMRDPAMLKLGPENKKGAVSSIAFNGNTGDGSLLAVGWRTGVFTVYGLQTLAEIAHYSHEGTNNGFICIFSPDGSMLAAGGGSADTTLHNINMESYVPSDLIPHQKHISAFASFATASRAVVAAGKELIGYDLTAGRGTSAKEMFRCTADELLDHLVELNPDGTQVAYSQRAHTNAVVYTFGNEQPQILEFKSGCDGVRFSPKGKWLVAWGGFGAMIFARQGGQWKTQHTISDPNYYIGDCIFSPDESLIATCGASKLVFVREVMNPTTPILTIGEGQGLFFTAAVCFCPTSTAKKFRLSYCAADMAGEHVRVCDVDLSSGVPKEKVCIETHVIGPPASLGPWDPEGTFKAHPKVSICNTVCHCTAAAV